MAILEPNLDPSPGELRRFAARNSWQQRAQVVDTADTEPGPHQIARCAVVFPAGRQHRRGQMTAGGVSGDHQMPLVPVPQPDADLPDVVDDLGQAGVRTQPVRRYGGRNAVYLEAAREMAEIALVEALPVAAVNEDLDRCARRRGGEDVEPFQGTLAVGQVQHRLQFRPAARAARGKVCEVRLEIGHRDPGIEVALQLFVAKRVMVHL